MNVSITSSVNGVLSQRLIRKLCEQCKRQTTVDTRFMRDLDQAVRRRIEDCVIYEGVDVQLVMKQVTAAVRRSMNCLF